MLPHEELKEALERLFAETASPGDQQRVQSATLSGDLIFTTGEGNVAIGGSANYFDQSSPSTPKMQPNRSFTMGC